MADPNRFGHFAHHVDPNFCFNVGEYGLTPDEIAYSYNPPPNPNMPPSSHSTGSTTASTSSTTGPKKRRTISKVWNEFKLEEVEQPDGEKK